MSDSDAALPSDATISRKLRDVVISIHKAGNTDDLTVKRVRAKAEEELGLSSGFFKTNQQWKQKSHDAIHEAVDKYCGDDAPEPDDPPPKKPTKPKPTAKKEKAASDSPRGVKRKPIAPAKKPRKRSKVVDSDDDSEAETSRPSHQADAPSDTDSEPPAKPARRINKVVVEEAEEEEEEQAPTMVSNELKESNDVAAPKSAANNEVTNDLSESELSSLIDEEPVQKKRQKKSQQAPLREPKSKAPKATKAKGKAASSKTDDDPAQAEIKRLQGWLVKCGIRKVWSKELAKYDTPKEKIKHLKGMLMDAGMGGKYSNEKAARIKEQREFAKDLEEIQQGELAWGKSREEDIGSRPRRRLHQPARRTVIEADDDDEDDDDDQKNKIGQSDGSEGSEDAQDQDDEDGEDGSE